jgi:hypothetical protein
VLSRDDVDDTLFFRQLRVQLKELEEKMQKVNADAATWSEFKNPEGRVYYYNSKTTESTWDKPIVFADVIGRVKRSFVIFFDSCLT